jgi:hypothetical protein
MFDMMTPISQAKKGDIILLKKLTEAQGYIIDHTVPLYFIELEKEKQYVKASLDPAFEKEIKLSLRAIKQITSPLGVFVYKADPRDIVYGQ